MFVRNKSQFNSLTRKIPIFLVLTKYQNVLCNARNIFIRKTFLLSLGILLRATVGITHS